MSDAIRGREATVRERTEELKTVLLPQTPELAGFEIPAEMVPASTVGAVTVTIVVQSGELGHAAEIRSRCVRFFRHIA